MPRIAFFPDSFHEVNGVAHTARQFVSFARRNGIPMLCLHAGSAQEPPLPTEGSVERLALDRGYWSVRLEQDLTFDPFFARHLQQIGQALRRFRPDVIHVTGPSELGLLGSWFSWRLGVPLVASWHTNLHEYAGRRLTKSLWRLGPTGERLGGRAERACLGVCARFYRRAQVLYAPNPTLCALLERHTGTPCHLMPRGVDSVLFSPAHRTRPRSNQLVLGYVGRLSVEKNVALLAEVHHQLRRRGLLPRWLIVGHGSEMNLLRHALGTDATFAGVLHGEALAAAFADMDLLVFPSRTDTFGNVVLEALGSGVPAVVTPEGGPAHIVRHGETGWVVPEEEFATVIAALFGDPERRGAAGVAARHYALGCSWDAVFRDVLAAYPGAHRTSSGDVSAGV